MQLSTQQPSMAVMERGPRKGILAISTGRCDATCTRLPGRLVDFMSGMRGAGMTIWSDVCYVMPRRRSGDGDDGFDSSRSDLDCGEFLCAGSGIQVEYIGQKKKKRRKKKGSEERARTTATVLFLFSSPQQYHIPPANQAHLRRDVVTAGAKP